MHNDRTCKTTADGDPGDEDDGLDGMRPTLFADPGHTAEACRQKFNLSYDPLVIRGGRDLKALEDAVLAAMRRRPQ